MKANFWPIFSTDAGCVWHISMLDTEFMHQQVGWAAITGLP